MDHGVRAYVAVNTGRAFDLPQNPRGRADVELTGFSIAPARLPWRGGAVPGSTWMGPFPLRFTSEGALRAYRMAEAEQGNGGRSIDAGSRGGRLQHVDPHHPQSAEPDWFPR